MRAYVWAGVGLGLCGIAAAWAGDGTAATQPAPATQPAEGEITPTPATASLLCITPKWMLWQTHELIEATAEHRAQMFIIRFYLQRRGQDRARLVETARDSNIRWRATVLDDGTLLLNFRGRLAWVSADGKLRSTPDLYPKVDGRSAEPLGLYPDGVILCTMLRKEDEPVRAWFVPIRKDGLVADSKVALTDDKGLRQATSIRTMPRHGEEFVWSDDAGLHIVNIASGTRRELPFAGGRIQAFDGQTAVGSNASFHLQSGQTKRLDEHFTFVAVRNRIGYAVQGVEQAIRAYGHPKHLKLLAVDLDSGRQRMLAKWPNAEVCYIADRGPMGQAFGNRVDYGYAPVLFAAEAEGLTFWDGTAWRKLKWLTRIDQPAT